MENIRSKYTRMWKIANVTPIHKKGSRKLRSNYKPVSIICIFESILKKVMKSHFEVQKLISIDKHMFVLLEGLCFLLIRMPRY